jgi:hypothetical protein
MFKPHFLLRLAAVFALAGIGWLAFRSGLSLRELAWDTAVFSFIPEAFGWTWNEWVTSAAVDRGITLTEKAIGVLSLLLAVLLARRKKATSGFLLCTIPFFALLLIRPLLFWKEHFYQIGALLELGMQTLAPVLFVWYLARSDHFMTQSGGRSGHKFWWCVSATVAVTFIGHGMYAIGFHPVPAHFVFMTQAGLGVGEDAARRLLVTVGVLDFLAAALLLLPWKKAWLVGLAWVIPWAILTTFARLWSYGGFVGFDTLLSQWLPQMVVRLPHILLPLALFFLARAQVQGEVSGSGGFSRHA